MGNISWVSDFSIVTDKWTEEEGRKKDWFYTLERLTFEESFIKIQYNFFLEFTFALEFCQFNVS